MMPVSFELMGYARYIAPALVLLVFLIVRLIVQEALYFKQYKLPGVVPGALPIIGNAHQIPRTGKAAFFTDLAKKHGEMMTLRLGGTPWLFLNSRRVAEELLQKRANIYSSRQMLPMGHEIVSSGNRVVLMPYNDLWRQERKILHQLLNSTQVKKFERFQDIESRTLLLNYLDQPSRFYTAHSRYANSVVMSVAFGRRTELDDPDLIELQATAAEFVQYFQPGSSIVDVFPFLSRLTWIPRSLQPWRWSGDALYKRTLKVYKKQFDILKEKMDQGDQTDCFLQSFFESGQNKNFTMEQICFIGGVLMEAGSDTTRISLHVAVAGMALWPDWVARARIELDAVCGSNAERLPELSDMPSLPLIKGAVKESLRWKPSIAETGIPHALIKDDTFEGYHIPAGTVVTWNHWAISNSETEYEQPDRFWPERFLGPDLDNPSGGHLGFGAGRRICVGLHVAQTNLALAIARLVYCFDMKENSSNPIDITKPFSEEGGKSPFEVKVQPRSLAHIDLIRKTCVEKL